MLIGKHSFWIDKGKQREKNRDVRQKQRHSVIDGSYLITQV